MKTHTKGLTLVDLIASLAILSILYELAAPAFFRLIERNKAATGINWIISAINITRISAVDYGSLTTLCPTQDDRRCSGIWHGRVMIFTDPNNDQTLNEGEHIITTLDFPHEGSTLKWRAFRNKQYLQMTSQGFTNFQNGNFVYCSREQNPLFSRQIVLNTQGRVKKSVDRNNDGLIEDRYGKHLRC